MSTRARTLGRPTRCENGRIMRHDPQFDDPYLETDIGRCEDCDGTGRNCEDCGAPHAEEAWEDCASNGPGTAIRQTILPLCESCADARRERSVP